MALLKVLNLKNQSSLYDSIVNIPYIENMYYEVRLKTKHRSKIVNFENYYMSNNITQIIGFKINYLTSMFSF